MHSIAETGLNENNKSIFKLCYNSTKLKVWNRRSLNRTKFDKWKMF